MKEKPIAVKPVSIKVKPMSINLVPRVCPPLKVKIIKFIKDLKKSMPEEVRQLISSHRSQKMVGLTGETNRSVIFAGGQPYYRVTITSKTLRGEIIYCLEEELSEIALHCLLKNN